MKRREFIAGLGGAAACPFAARAQGDRVRRIGVLMGLDENDPEVKLRQSAFTQALADLGWTESRNIRMDVRWAGGDINRMRALAQELVALQPDIILASASAVTAALQRETRTIPIVMANVVEPVDRGFVAGINQPGGNITGFASTRPRWEASGLSCSPRLRPASSGLQSCSILIRLSHRLICPRLRRRPGHSRSR